MDFRWLPCSPTTFWSVLPQLYPNHLSAGCARKPLRFHSSYFNQVYEDKCLWIVTVSYIRKGDFMIYVGLDIAKLNHFASALSSDGEILLQPFSFSNSYDGFCKLQTKLELFGTDNLVIALESTAHYGNNLVEYLVLNGYKVCILNPLQTSSLRRRNSFPRPLHKRYGGKLKNSSTEVCHLQRQLYFYSVNPNHCPD